MKIVTNKYSKKTPKSKVVLLNPSEKSKLYAASLKSDRKVYINAETGVVEKGNKPLSKAKRAYRQGYLQARKDNSKAYNANKKKR